MVCIVTGTALMAKLITVANMKGGVGKTATVISLAETLAAQSIDRAVKSGSEPKSVLVVDFDAQASASFALAGDERLVFLIENRQTIDGFLDRFLIRREEIELSTLTVRQISDVSHRGFPLRIGLLASSPLLRMVERNLIHSLTRGGYSLERIEHDLYHLLAGQLAELGRSYDYVIFDCPPGISLLTEIALRMADLTIVPTVPDFLSLLGLDAFSQNVWNRLASTRNGLPMPHSGPHVLITKRRDAPSQDRKVIELRRRGMDSKAPYRVLQTEVPETAGIEDALERVTTFPNYAQKWNAQLRSNLVDLTAEVDALLGVIS
jgi:chromosome partitioning protein